MRIGSSYSIVIFSRLLLLAFLLTGGDGKVFGQLVIPGTGERVANAFDNFEDEEWTFTHNFPKSSRNLDKQTREPTGYSSNQMWFESPKRGQPDIIKRVATPAGGLPGSKGSMLMRSLQTGSPGRPRFKSQQDDLIMDLSGAVGGSLSVQYYPSFVVRVYLPPFEQWEQATDTSFGLRASVTGIGPMEVKSRRGKLLAALYRRRNRTPRIKRGVDVFYPGMFIQFNRKEDTGEKEDTAVFIIRGNDQGEDFFGPTITKTKTGWWTLGMSFSPDGRVHYFAKPGVENLTAKDHIASHFSQSVRCQYFNTIFFNVVSQDTGRSWSTPWIIDDPTLYYVRNWQEASQRRTLRR